MQAPREPEAEPGGEELWEQEMARLCLSQQPVRVLPYAMVDKRFIRWVPANPAEHGGGRAVGVGVGLGVGWGNAPVRRGRGGSSSPGNSLAQGAALPGQVGMLADSGHPPPHHHPILGSCGSPRG